MHIAHRECIWTVADETILMRSLDQCPFFLLEPAKDDKVRFTQCELAIYLPMPDTEIQGGGHGKCRSVLMMCTHLRTLLGFVLP